MDIMEAETLKNNSVDGSNKNGGARPGAGRPKGGMNEDTKIRMIAKKHFIDRVAKNTDKLFNAQLNKAIGETYLMRVTTIGKVKETEVVTNQETIKAYLDDTLEADDNEYYYISTKPTDNMAIQGLLDRAFGRAAEKVTIDGEMKNTHSLIEASDEELNERIQQHLRRHLNS
jgi:hypothetical protein